MLWWLFLCFWPLFFICNKNVSLSGIFGSSFLSLGHFKCLFASLASKREIVFAWNESKSMKSQIRRGRKSLFWDWRCLLNSMGTSLKKMVRCQKSWSCIENPRLIVVAILQHLQDLHISCKKILFIDAKIKNKIIHWNDRTSVVEYQPFPFFLIVIVLYITYKT